MSAKKVNQATSIDGGNNKSKGSQARNKSRRRSSRNASNGDTDLDTKEKSCTKRSRDTNSSKFESFDQDDAYKDIIDVVPSADLNCSPTEMPALPGTRVTLHGVILHETQGGLIVLNVRWRNKIYSGALIDVEKSKWASDRLPSECNGGNKGFQTPPPIKKIKIPSGSNTEDSCDVKKKNVTSPTSGKSKSRPNAKKRSNADRDASPPLSLSEDVPTKKHKNKTNLANQNGGNTDGWIECPEPKCGKKYKNKNGLTCHIRKIHKSESLDESGKENKSESQEDSDSGDDNFVIDERAEEDRVNANNKDAPTKLTKENTDPVAAETCETKNIIEAKLPTEPSLKDEMTENEKQIEKLKLETEKARAQIEMFKQEKVETEDTAVERVDADNKNMTTTIKNEEKDEKVPIENIKEEIKQPEPMKTDIKKEEPEIENENSKETEKSQISLTPTSLPPPSTPPKLPIASTTDNAVSKTESDTLHPRGSSRTIIHQDHVHSLNELFSPAAHNFHQFSPTLSSLNPQKINDSLTNAFKQRQQEKLMKNVPATTTTSTTTPSEVSEPVKAPLGPKPSIDFKPMENSNETEIMRKYGKEFVSLTSLSQSPVITDESKKQLSLDKTSSVSITEIIDCSDNESTQPCKEVLKGCFKVYPQIIDDVKPPSNMTSSLADKEPSHSNNQFKNMFSQRMNNPFENKLMLEELASKVSNFGTYPNLPQNHQPGKMVPTSVPMGGIPNNILKGMFRFPTSDASNFTDALNYMKQAGVQRGNREDSRNPLEIPQNLLATKDGGHPMKPTSLLEQRLMAQHPKVDINHMMTKNLLYSLQFQGGKDDSPDGSHQSVENKTNVHPDRKMSPQSNTFMSREHPFDKQKFSAGNLRINPPVNIEERVNISQTWFPEVSKDPYFNGPSSSAGAFRPPNLKSTNAPSNQPNSMSNDKIKAFQKRPGQPVPIAPAPQSNQQPTSPFISPTNEYISSEAAEKDAAMMYRHTLTPDNRLIPSPAENRGRPRKIRGKLAQVPISSQEVPSSKLRSPNELGLHRKPSSSPVVRASVIQGSTHPTLDNVSLVKSPEREGQSLMAAMSRPPFDGGLEERYMNPSQHTEHKLHPEMQRSLAEKYKNLSSPPGIYFSGGQARSMISPQNARPPSNSPRPDFPMSRASPSVNAELFREGGFHQRPMERLDKLSLLNEHVHPKSDLLRSPSEHVLMPDSSRKSISPHEALQMMEAFKRESRLVSQGNRFPMPQNHRPDVGHSHDIPVSLLDRRPGGMDENDHARYMAMQQERKRLLQHAALTQAGLFGGGTPPSGPSPGEHNSHHPNLFLERRDGAFLGPLSSFQNRSGDSHKR